MPGSGVGRGGRGWLVRARANVPKSAAKKAVAFMGMPPNAFDMHSQE